jgi:hypothetical protein
MRKQLIFSVFRHFREGSIPHNRAGPFILLNNFCELAFQWIMLPCREKMRLPHVLAILALCGLGAGCDGQGGRIYSPPEFDDPAHPVDMSHPPAVRIIAPADGAKFPAHSDIRLLALATPHGTSLEPDAHTKRYADTNKWNFGRIERTEVVVEFLAGTNSLGSDGTGLVFAGMRSQHGEAVPLVMSPVGYPAVEWIWRNATAGRYTLTARATNQTGLATVSTPVNITVLP